MTTAADLLENLQKVNINEIVKSSLEKTADYLVEANQLQLDSGKDSKGKSLPDYSAASVEVFGKEPGPMTLHDTGDFYNGMFLKVDADSYELSSTDPKTDKLQADYGPDILGIEEKDKEYYVENKLQPEVNKHITDITGLKFE